ncbi:hypothetical protein RFI_00750 [Reticulomyxa filosa]|uniref:BTB domain-containing protein n=1 Tax=Reticulomyxa filosa TaxID=46433 RepID=X6PDX7_RETFI|nr:hypothetical protein RFI_00750 [Reticulomyxa filosa]|eukprot:ETO36313.1 hypothetical protein RFI_00750 [Reticulomyxa filosa]
MRLQEQQKQKQKNWPSTQIELTIDAQDTTARYFINAIKYMYEGSITIDANAIVPLLVLSSQLRLRGTMCGELRQKSFEDYMNIDNCLMFLKQANSLNYASLVYECCQFALTNLRKIPCQHFETYLHRWKDFKSLFLFGLRQEANGVYFGGELIVLYLKSLLLVDKSKAITAILELNNIEEFTKLTSSHALAMLLLCDNLLGEKKPLDRFILTKVGVYHLIVQIGLCFSEIKVYRIAVYTIACQFPLDVNDSMWEQLKLLSIDTFGLLLRHAVIQTQRVPKEKALVLRLINCYKIAHLVSEKMNTSLDQLLDELFGKSENINPDHCDEDQKVAKEALSATGVENVRLGDDTTQQLSGGRGRTSNDKDQMILAHVPNALSTDRKENDADTLGFVTPKMKSSSANLLGPNDCKLADTPELSRFAKHFLLDQSSMNTSDDRYSHLLQQMSPIVSHQKNSDITGKLLQSDKDIFRTCSNDMCHISFLSSKNGDTEQKSILTDEHQNTPRQLQVLISEKVGSASRTALMSNSNNKIFETPTKSKPEEKEEAKELQRTPIQEFSQGRFDGKAKDQSNHLTKMLLQTPLVENKSGGLTLCENSITKIRLQSESSDQSPANHSGQKMASANDSPNRSSPRRKWFCCIFVFYVTQNINYPFKNLTLGRANGATCVECGKYRHKYDFTKSQWRNRPRDFRRCKYCTGEGGTDSRTSSYDSTNYSIRGSSYGSNIFQKMISTWVVVFVKFHKYHSIVIWKDLLSFNKKIF